MINPTINAPALVRRLTRANQEMGPRLAFFEFQEMMKELENGNLFELSIDFPEVALPASSNLPELPEDPISARMPKLNVTLGKTAWVKDPSDLPVIGIYFESRTDKPIRDAIGSLMTAHYLNPFARFVFLCESLRPIPFLGRYGFTYEHLRARTPREAVRRLHFRYGARQLRDLMSGDTMWHRPETAE